MEVTDDALLPVDDRPVDIEAEDFVRGDGDR